MLAYDANIIYATNEIRASVNGFIFNFLCLLFRSLSWVFPSNDFFFPFSPSNCLEDLLSPLNIRNESEINDEISVTQNRLK